MSEKPADTNPPGATPPPPKFGLWGVIVVVVIAVLFVFGLLPRLRHDRELKKDTAELAVPTVNIVTPAPGKRVAGLTLPAEVRPFVEAPIYARANGYLTNWSADIGARVDSGSLLAVINTPDLDEEL